VFPVSFHCISPETDIALKVKNNKNASSMSRKLGLQHPENLPMTNLSRACHDTTIYMANMAEAALDAGYSLKIA
jgi:hypothetical protein